MVGRSVCVHDCCASDHSQRSSRLFLAPLPSPLAHSRVPFSLSILAVERKRPARAAAAAGLLGQTRRRRSRSFAPSSPNSKDSAAAAVDKERRRKLTLPSWRIRSHSLSVGRDGETAGVCVRDSVRASERPTSVVLRPQNSHLIMECREWHDTTLTLQCRPRCQEIAARTECLIPG